MGCAMLKTILENQSLLYWELSTSLGHSPNAKKRRHAASSLMHLHNRAASGRLRHMAGQMAVLGWRDLQK